MTDTEIAARLLLSMLFGTLVGIERQWHHKNAGLKTNTLVAVGAAAFALISERGFGPNSNPSQLAAGVVTGIGFIGGGVIMRRGGSVQGINSAATLWATASMGLAIGAGYYRLAWLVLAVVLGIQFVLRWLANWIDKRSGFVTPNVSYQLEVCFLPAMSETIGKIWSSFVNQAGVSILHYSEAQKSDSENQMEATLALSETRTRDLTLLSHQFAAVEGVLRAEWSETRAREDD